MHAALPFPTGGFFMTAHKNFQRLILPLSLLFCSASLLAQTQQQRPEQKDDVVRVYTELVQTDVMVFDKNGRFVNDLRREDFELRINGKAIPIEFFERVKAGSANEEAQLDAARGTGTSRVGVPVPLDRGRTVFFYLDDLHLDLAATQLARRMLLQYIDREMGQNDQAAITSASGQIGFLQQLTDNKSVLREALERLGPRITSVRDLQRPPMTEYQALLISRYDQDVTEYFMDALMREMPGLSRDVAEQMVRERAQQMLLQAANITRATMSGLESLLKSSAKLPGRKVVFFVSNGFFLDERNSDTLERLRNVTSAAAKSGAVIYTFDARGLVASLTDASTDVAFDVSGKLDRASHGELLASQDALNALAADTGGKAIFNTNALEPGLKRALEETSTYYLLAWKPTPETSAAERKIEVKILNRTDLSIRGRRAFSHSEPATATNDNKTNKAQKTAPEASLAAAISSAFPEEALPVALSLVHLNLEDRGDLLSVSMQAPREFLTFSTDSGDKQRAVVQIAGTLHNARGQVGARFSERISVAPPARDVNGDGVTDARSSSVGYTFPVFLKPGLYQARVAMVDEKSGKAGSAHGWIEISDFSSKQLGMSSILIGERDGGNIVNASDKTTPDKQVNVSIDKRFRRGSYLRFLVFVYNASLSRDTLRPDVAAQVQVVRDGQPVITSALRKIDSEGIKDLTRLPSAAEIHLDDLSVGQYVLIVTAVDRVSKRSVSQQTKFQVVN